MEPRFVAGPPGTGKTHGFLVEKYREGFLKYGPDKIVLLSHTNTAANQIIEAILKMKEVKELGLDKVYFGDRICTIHHFCRSKIMKKEVFDNKQSDDYNKLCSLPGGVAFRLAKFTGDVYKNHPFFKFISHAHGKDLSDDLEKHFNTCADRQEYYPYKYPQLQKLNVIYTKYKKDTIQHDFADMLNEFNSLDNILDIEMLIVDEAQDCNKPQLRAINKMAQNVKDEHFYMVGDPDQTIFEFAGSDAHYFHTISANPYKELENGKRCSKAVNDYCKKTIAPIWEEYGYVRKWYPATYDDYHSKRNLIPEGFKHGDLIEGNKYDLTDLKSSKSLSLLLDKMRNSNQSFLFCYRGKPTDKRITEFLKDNGFEFSYVEGSPHVSKEELRCHNEWPSFYSGSPKSKYQIKQFWKYLGKKAIPIGKGTFAFDEGNFKINKDYSIDDLIKDGLLKDKNFLNPSFDLIRKRSKGKDEKEHEDRMIYIKNVIRNGFDYDAKIRIEHGNIHKVKGMTYDNVIGDLSLTRKKPEPEFVQYRLKFTMFSRAIFDIWVLATSTGKELGKYGCKPRTIERVIL
tara:strand:- start:137 stop:1843 length:1707 start_codon:yes stop_codon:yes gene_type:complete